MLKRSSNRDIKPKISPATTSAIVYGILNLLIAKATPIAKVNAPRSGAKLEGGRTLIRREKDRSPLEVQPDEADMSPNQRSAEQTENLGFCFD